MQNVSDMWLRGQAAQQSFIQLATYNAVFMGNAAIHAMRLGLSAPTTFWSAMGRAGLPVSADAPVAAPTPAKTAKPKAAKLKAVAAPAPAKAAKAEAPAAAKLAPAEKVAAVGAVPDAVIAPKPKAKAAPKMAAPKVAAPAKTAVPKAAAPKAAAPKATAPAKTAAPKAAAAAKAAAPIAAAPAKAAAGPKAKAPKAAAKAAAEPVAKAAPAKAAAKPKAPKAAAKVAPVAEATTVSFLLDAPRGGKADPLVELKGVGEKLATSLNDFGIYHFDQIAGLTPDQLDWLDENQRGFRLVQGRYDLIGQAKARG